MGTDATQIRVRGTVQGVGFRPTVWRLAHEEGLVGEVLNDGSGVLVILKGEERAISRFVTRLRTEAPPLARIEAMEISALIGARDYRGFAIVASREGENRTRVTADAATCAACRREISDPTERRYRYPFTNCTHCGPRFSIVRSVPYDRSRTTMAAFAMCGDCAREYADPADRRFHAQPIACPRCGPRVWLESHSGKVEHRGHRAIEAALEALDRGRVVALRGLGGFHLACDASDAHAVAVLRRRKHRFGKPFALMARDAEMVARYCRLDAEERKALESPEAPIVLLDARAGCGLAPGVAPGLDTVGFMLPYTPLHHLLMKERASPLVMTSGNRSSEPQVTENDSARAKLAQIADQFLSHDREIANRIDDSVVRVMAGKPRILRRARGFAPRALPLPSGFERAPDLLAYGGQLKATFCLLHDGAAVLSQHQGDLEDAETYADYEKNLRLYAELYDHRPSLVVSDIHPDYLSTKLASKRADRDDLPLSRVQHHHAHVASCLAEHGVPLATKPVLGIALDGAGLGDDGTVWGAEFLVADYLGYRRVASFEPIALLGGDRAVQEPWRSVYAHLSSTSGWREVGRRYPSLELVAFLESRPLTTLDRMRERAINAPLASSCGRLFDAVAAALGLRRERVLFEGQGAMELEALASRWRASGGEEEAAYRFDVTRSEKGLRLGFASLWQALLADLAAEVPRGAIAARFHGGLVDAVATMAEEIVASTPAGEEIPRITTVALSGGCFQNRLLLEGVKKRIESAGLRCLAHSEVPANDGGLALGQAVVAAARQLSGSEPVTPLAAAPSTQS